MSETSAEARIDGTARDLERAQALVERLQRRSDELAERLLEAEQALAAGHRPLEEARAELAARELELTALEQALEERQSELGALEQRLAAREADTSALEARLAQLEERERLEAAQRARIEELEHDVWAREAERARQEAELRGRVEELEREIAALEAERARREAEQLGQVQELRAQLTLLLTSESWRLTEPLRALARAARSLAAAPRRARGRRASSAQVPAGDGHVAASGPPRTRIVFVSGEPDTPGHTYRVGRVASALAPSYFETTVLRLDELGSRLAELENADVLWIWRARWSGEIASAIDTVRRGGGKVVFDVDDLMFRPELAKADVIDGIRTHELAEQVVQDHFSDVQRVLAAADHCTLPTTTLARSTHRHAKPATVIPNGFDAAMLRTARAAYRARTSARDDDLLRIGYASGSFTHQRDVAVAARALARVLSERPDVRLVLFERTVDLDEFPELAALRRQIEWRSLVLLEQLPAEYARFDVNIAPLEVGNLFCEAKSELKYFEAALVGVPTIASPTEPMATAIRDGETGLLAADERSWYDGLTLLLDDDGARKRIGEAAYRDVLWQFGPERRAALTTRLVHGLLASPAVASELSRAGLGDLAAAPEAPDVPEFEVLFESPRRSESRVTVVVPLYNYAHLLEEALESVRRQTVHRDLDLVVVDDASTDESVDVARSWLTRRASDFNRVALLQNTTNSGLARSRNAGVWYADTELYLPLDPDNVLLPDCIELGIAALDETGASVALPSIETFGDGSGMLPALGWEPALFQRGNYIDAMALVRRACWLAAGGYSPFDVPGWEDFDLWCKFAERGFFGVQIPRRTARYRVHSASMLQRVTEKPDKKPLLVTEITRRHPWVDIAHPEPVLARAIVRDESADEVRAPEGEAAERLREILRCPETGEPLDFSSPSVAVSVPGGREWPVVEGRPVFVPAGASVTRHSDEHLSNPLPEEAVQLFRDANGALVLNLSAGGTEVRYPNVIEAEYAIFRHTDVVVDAHALPFADESFEVVVSLNAFEHYREPERAMGEIWRVLKPGGRLFLRTAFLQPMHEEPHHFYNATKYGVEHWLARFEVEDLRVSDNFHPLYALSWLAADLESGYAELSSNTAESFRRTRVDELARFWREPDELESELWSRFSELPPRTREKAAAGWQVLARKQG